MFRDGPLLLLLFCFFFDGGWGEGGWKFLKKKTVAETVNTEINCIQVKKKKCLQEDGDQKTQIVIFYCVLLNLS